MRQYLRNLAWRWLLGLAREHDEEIAAIVRMRLRHGLIEPDRRDLLVDLEARAGGAAALYAPLGPRNARGRQPQQISRQSE